MNYLFIMEDFDLTVEAIVDATDGGDRVGSAHDELYFLFSSGGF
jgi:predicted DNA-binding protein